MSLWHLTLNFVYIVSYQPHKLLHVQTTTYRRKCGVPFLIRSCRLTGFLGLNSGLAKSPGKDTLLVERPLLLWREGGRGLFKSSRSGIMGAELERFMARGGCCLVLESTSSSDPATLRLLCKFLYTMNKVLAANESLNQLTTTRGTHTHRTKRMKYTVSESECIRQRYSFSVANPGLERVNSRTHSASTVRI